MAGVAAEDALELWAFSLREVKRRIRPLFAQERVAASAGLFLDGLLGPQRRKTGWMRAEAAGDPGPWRQQAILGRGRWEADALRDLVRDYAVETLAEPDAVLVIDETGFLKQGKASCGVARQYTGSAGKITDCQVGVFAAYVSRHGHALIDRALYLPEAWTDDPARLAAAHVPPGAAFATKPRLALAMIERADRGRGAVRLGGGRQRRSGEGAWARWRRRCAGPARATCSGSTPRSPFNSWIGKPAVAGTAEAIARGLDPAAWRRLSAGEGTKGPRLHDWACLELADLDGGRVRRPPRRPVDAGPAGPPQPRRRRARLLLDLVPGRDRDRDPGQGRGAALGDRGRASRPPRPSSGWTTTRPAPGTAGTATSRSSGSPSPCWRPSATTRTRRRPQKPRSGSPGHAGPHPLVGPGAPPRRCPSRPATHPARPRHRLVALATRPPGRRTTLPPEAENATVMLALPCHLRLG